MKKHGPGWRSGGVDSSTRKQRAKRASKPIRTRKRRRRDGYDDTPPEDCELRPEVASSIELHHCRALGALLLPRQCVTNRARLRAAQSPASGDAVSRLMLACCEGCPGVEALGAPVREVALGRPVRIGASHAKNLRRSAGRKPAACAPHEITVRALARLAGLAPVTVRQILERKKLPWRREIEDDLSSAIIYERAAVAKWFFARTGRELPPACDPVAELELVRVRKLRSIVLDPIQHVANDHVGSRLTREP